MGLVDVAIVSAYIEFREAQKRSNMPPVSHSELLMELHASLLQLEEEDFVERDPNDEDAEGAGLAPLPKDHKPEKSPHYQFVNGVRKRR
ncbi:hypothetical protein PI124_g16220 [Phytophthora idaei]|nr:hypothetical protein PI124_g16220 [Phytophthora idaei]